MLLLLGCVVDEPIKEETKTCAACAGECLEETIPPTSANHVEGDLSYASYPPSSGDHNPCWSTWGVFTEPVLPENFVHNLEHGGVVFIYDPTALEADLAALTALVTAFPQGRAILTPASEPMAMKFAAVSWGHRVQLGCYDEAALSTFFWANVGNAPEDVTSNPSSACTMQDTGGDSGDTAAP